MPHETPGSRHVRPSCRVKDEVNDDVGFYTAKQGDAQHVFQDAPFFGLGSSSMLPKYLDTKKREFPYSWPISVCHLFAVDALMLCPRSPTLIGVRAILAR